MLLGPAKAVIGDSNSNREKTITNNLFGTLTDHYYEFHLTHTALEIGGVPFGLTNGFGSKTKIKEVLNDG